MGGVETGIRQKYLGLEKFGIDVEFLFLQDNGGRSIFDGIDIKLYHPKDESETENIICNNNYDVISSIDCPEVHGFLSKVSDKTKIICEVRMLYPEGLLKYIENRDFPFGLKCIITPSKTYKKIIEDMVGSIPVHAIYNPVNERFFVRSSDCSSFSKQYIGWIGRLGDLKNYKELFKIAEILSSQRPGVEFVIGAKLIGHDSKISQIISDFGGRVNFKWLPLIEYQNIHHFYRLLRDSGGCFLRTSRLETLSNAILESMASECPVVATDIEVFKEVLDDGRCGAIYPSGDIESAAALINKVLDDKDYRQSIVENAYAKIKNGFTTDKIYTEWRNLLEDICKA